MIVMFIYDLDIYDDFDLIATFQHSESDWIGFNRSVKRNAESKAEVSAARWTYFMQNSTTLSLFAQITNMQIEKRVN